MESGLIKRIVFKSDIVFVGNTPKNTPKHDQSCIHYSRRQNRSELYNSSEILVRTYGPSEWEWDDDLCRL